MEIGSSGSNPAWISDSTEFRQDEAARARARARARLFAAGEKEFRPIGEDSFARYGAIKVGPYGKNAGFAISRRWWTVRSSGPVVALYVASRRTSRRAARRECAGQWSVSAAEVAALARTECLYLALRSIGDSVEMVAAAGSERSRPRRETRAELRLRVQARG